MSAVLLPNALETTLSRLPPCLAAHHVSKKHSFLLFKQTVDDLYLTVFRYTAAVGFIQKPLQTCSALHLVLK